MSYKTRIAPGEGRIFSMHEELILRISLEDINLNLNYFDTFSFITTNEFLIIDSNLVFYNNLCDSRGILTELPDELISCDKSDIELKINLKELIPVIEKIEVYISIKKLKEKVKFNFFNEKNNQKARLKIFFELVDKSENRIENGELYIENLVNTNGEINVKLLELTKNSNDSYKLFFQAELINKDLENIIASKLK